MWLDIQYILYTLNPFKISSILIFMKAGIFSDTHMDKYGTIPLIIQEFQKEKVDFIIVTGDLYEKHLTRDIFKNFPVIYATVSNQIEMEEFKRLDNFKETGFYFTKPVFYGGPSNRIVNLKTLNLGNEIIYVGHDRSYDFQYDKMEVGIKGLFKINSSENIGIRWWFAGGDHKPKLIVDGLFKFVDTGAAALEQSYGNGAEYGILDFDEDTISFKRLLPIEVIEKKKDPNFEIKNTDNIALIYNTIGITQPYNDPDYYNKLKNHLKTRHDITNLIHLGKIDVTDIGREELSDFKVYLNLSMQKIDEFEKLGKPLPPNWVYMEGGKKYVEVGKGFKILFEPNLGMEIKKRSEEDLFDLEKRLVAEDENLTHVCFDSHLPHCSGLDLIKVISPGNSVKDRYYSVISHPKNEITFGRIPL